MTVNDHDKRHVVPIARRFHELGFRIFATEGTARHLRARGVPAERVLKVHEGRPNAIDLLVSGEVQLLINTPLGKLTQQDDYSCAAPRCSTACRTPRRCRRPRRPATPSSRSGAAPARCARCRSGTSWPAR